MQALPAPCPAAGGSAHAGSAVQPHVQALDAQLCPAAGCGAPVLRKLAGPRRGRRACARKWPAAESAPASVHRRLRREEGGV
jgi:hypothetical protein